MALKAGERAMRPPFIRTVPDEVERYGALAAIVLAHIRYRCESDGPDRFERDGFRWWRVSRRNLGYEVGASADAVKRALEKLGADVVSANNSDRPDDQTRAYRAADNRDPLTSQKVESPRSDLPEGEIARDLGEIATVPGRNRHLHSIYIETLETKEREGGEEDGGAPDEPEPLDVETVPVPANAHPPQNQSSRRQTDPADAWVDAEVRADPDPEPPLYCKRHMPDGTDDSCPACGNRRRVHERWERRQPGDSKLRAWAALARELRDAAPPRSQKHRHSALAQLRTNRRTAQHDAIRRRGFPDPMAGHAAGATVTLRSRRPAASAARTPRLQPRNRHEAPKWRRPGCA